MMVISADFHLNDDTPEDLGYGKRLLDDAGALALASNCKYVTIAGDILHHKHKLSINILVTVYETLERWKQRGVTFILLRGNHDCPDLNNPEMTPLRLFASVATVVSTTRVVEEADYVLALVPWFPAERYIKEVATAAKICMNINKPRILISHISLKEGKVSPSNVKLSTPVRAEHLLPGIWTGGVYLGDYHAAQTIGKNIHYLGAPRPTTFGDFDCLGMWLMCATSKTLLPLPSRYPAFVTYRIDTKNDLPLKNWDNRNRNRIYLPSRLVQHVALHYPSANLILLDEEKIAPKNRMEGASKLNPLHVALRWREMKGLPAEPYNSEICRLMGETK